MKKRPNWGLLAIFAVLLFLVASPASAWVQWLTRGVARVGGLSIMGPTFYLNGSQVTPTAAEFNVLHGAPAQVALTVGTKANKTIAVSGQVEDAAGNALTGAYGVRFFLSDSANGLGQLANPPDGTASIGASGSVLVTDKATADYLLETDASGSFMFDVGSSSAGTCYPAVFVPFTGKVSTGSAMAF